MNAQSAQAAKQPVVLAVDNESNSLGAIRKVLPQLNARLLLTDSPAKALQLLTSKSVDVIIADMRMPGANGAEFLAQAAQIQPNAFRIILNGRADVDAMLKAINDNKVHRYLLEPWEDKVLKESIAEGIERSHLRNENARLLALTRAQNERLATINQTLSSKVKLRTRQIKAALNSTQQHSQALERVLYNLIVSHPSIDGGFARQVSESAQQLAATLGLNTKDQFVIRLAGLICEIGLIGIPADIIDRPFAELNIQQQQRYISQVEQAKLILAPLVSLESEIELIAKQFDSVHAKPSPPTGARIIAICRDYWRYRTGRILPRKLSAKDSRKEMQKYQGVKYDKSILRQFIQQDIKLLATAHEGQLTTRQLLPGMILRSDLYNAEHFLLLPQGHVFTEASIAKLIHIETGWDLALSIDIVDEEKTQEATENCENGSTKTSPQNNPQESLASNAEREPSDPSEPQ
ncbi:HD domain-containing phosphohydrolase [Alteromonas flava]|uniref:HD domain-containing phosphohydrolase n=1 Tax=Alteromonas flava TaxID=2048003 RepID=UPI000C281A91|nr:HD domain-containing phosphohydrolase [Alteromonas flava]